MTLIVGVAVSSGIVIAGDRRIQEPLFYRGEDVSRKVGLIGSRYTYGTSGCPYFDDAFTTQKIESLASWAPMPGGSTALGIHGLADGTRGVRAAAIRGQRKLHEYLQDHLRRYPDTPAEKRDFHVLLGGVNSNGIGRLFQFMVSTKGSVEQDTGITPRGSTEDPTLCWMGAWHAGERILLREELCGGQLLSSISTRVDPSCLIRPLPLDRLTLDEAILLAAAVVQEAVDSDAFPEVTGGVDVVVATREGVRTLGRRDHYPHLDDLTFLPPRAAS